MKYFIILFALFFSASLLAQEENGSDLVDFKLFLYQHDENTKTITIAAEFTMEKHWHTYWINPGDAGLPTYVDWQLPDNIKLVSENWPYPEKIPFADMANFGYENVTAAFFTFKYDGKADFSKISAKASWLVCKEKCLPGSADANLTTDTDAKKKSELASFESKLPIKTNTKGSFRQDGERLIVTLEMPALSDAKIFPVNEGIFENAKDAILQRDADGFTFTLFLSDFRVEDPNQFELLIISNELLKSYGKESIIVKLNK